MNTPPVLLQSALGDLFAQANSTGYLTLADRYGLMAAIFGILEGTITEEEKCSIDRLLRAVCRGRIKVVNEISALQ